MSIRFACKCGKHLRAGDTMAGRHTLCPKCGALVAIPTLEQAASGAALPRARPPTSDASQPPAAEDDAEEIGPILVRVRRRNDKDPNKFRKSIWVPLDPDRGPPPEKLPRPVRTTRRRYEWRLETYWFQCLSYTFRAWYLLTGLALAQAALLLWTAVLLPKWYGANGARPAHEPLVLLGAAVVLGIYTLALFDCVLSSAGAGEYRIFRLPGIDLGILGVASWVMCFLAGPVVPAGIGLWYWHGCGDPDAIDWIILAELAGAAFGYWLLEVLAAREAGGWWADPLAVDAIVSRLGPRALLAAAGPPVLAYVVIRLVLSGMAHLHFDGAFALPRLAVATLTGMFGTTFFLRVLGVWSYHSRPAQSQEESPDKPDPVPEPKGDD